MHPFWQFSSLLTVHTLKSIDVFTPYLCLQKMRDRRIAECVELRKTQKVESIMKRRNISSVGDEEPLSPEYNTDNKQVFAS